MARNEDGHGIASDRGSDSAKAIGPTHELSERHVGDCCAVGDPQQPQPDRSLERRAPGVERELESLPHTCEVLLELLGCASERGRSLSVFSQILRKT
jgi:hypothetical protein